MTQRLVVTGAAGFLGGHLVRGGEARNMQTLSVVRAAGSRESSSTATMDELFADPARLDGADVLVHAAAVRHRHGTPSSAYRAANVELVEALVRAAAGRVGRFVFVSSVGVYGWPEALPVTEATSMEPRTLYSATKVEAEKIVVRLARELGLPYTIVRPTIIYGRGDNNGMLDKLAAMLRQGRYRIVGDGANVLHHTHIDDVVDGVFALSETERGKNEDFIVAGPETTTLARLSELVAERVGARVPRLHVPLPLARTVATVIDAAAWRGLAFTEREPPINHEKLDVMTLDIAFDPAKARAAGFSPRVGYVEGVRRTLEPAAA